MSMPIISAQQLNTQEIHAPSYNHNADKSGILCKVLPMTAVVHSREVAHVDMKTSSRTSGGVVHTTPTGIRSESIPESVQRKISALDEQLQQHLVRPELRQENYNWLLSAKSPQEFAERINATNAVIKCMESSDTHFDLSRKNLGALPPVISLLATQITSINLSENKLSHLNRLAGFNKLTQINCAHNYVDDLEVLKSLPALKVFMAKDNRIFKLDAINKQPSLECLDVSENMVHELKIKDHPNIKDINISRQNPAPCKGRMAALIAAWPLTMGTSTHSMYSARYNNQTFLHEHEFDEVDIKNAPALMHLDTSGNHKLEKVSLKGVPSKLDHIQ